MTYVARELTPEDARQVLDRLLSYEKYSTCGATLRGEIELTCREPDGTPAWRVIQPNLFTDSGRRLFAEVGFPASGIYLFTSPSTETASQSRTALPDETSSTQHSTALSATSDNSTLIKQWFYTFPAPASNKLIGTVGIESKLPSSTASSMVSRIVAYTVLSPTKTQTTTQTLELLYRVAFTPVY